MKDFQKLLHNIAPRINDACAFASLSWDPMRLTLFKTRRIDQQKNEGKCLHDG